MIDTNSLEWKLRKLGENMDMLSHALSVNRSGGYGWNLYAPSMGKVKRPWQK